MLYPSYRVCISLHNVALASPSLDCKCHFSLSHDTVDSFFFSNGDKSSAVISSITLLLSCNRQSSTLFFPSISLDISYDTQLSEILSQIAIIIGRVTGSPHTKYISRTLSGNMDPVHQHTSFLNLTSCCFLGGINFPTLLGCKLVLQLSLHSQGGRLHLQKLFHVSNFVYW